MGKISLWIIAISFLLPVVAWGGEYLEDDTIRYIYNPIDNTWQVGSNKAFIKYNPMRNEWPYVVSGKVIRFNPADNNWDYEFPDSQLHYNIIREGWFNERRPMTQERYVETIPLTSPTP